MSEGQDGKQLPTEAGLEEGHSQQWNGECKSFVARTSFLRS